MGPPAIGFARFAKNITRSAEPVYRPGPSPKRLRLARLAQERTTTGILHAVRQPGNEPLRQPAAYPAPDIREYQRRPHVILRRIHDAPTFDEALPQLEAEMLALVGAERMTVYQRGRHNREIVSRFKTGEEVRGIRVPVGPTSVAGYVALTQEPVRIEDV
ncbi:hypothetical protein [Thiohalorhabdus sp.]|uniref:hypothetical protein n=1 Tax=Thiohalorhabdus sp. TaxID=3094134 RepID=UPI002FC3C931